MSAPAKQRVLLVDDEPQVLVALEDLLSEQFQVLKAESGEHALALLESEGDVAAIVTDQRMPHMNRDEMLAQMAPENDASRILLTGYADLGAVIRAVNEGRIFAYVTKPWNGDDLKVKVQQAVDRFRLGRELAAEREALRQSESRLQRQTSLLNSILNSMEEGVVVAGRTGSFLVFNDQAARILGRRGDDVTAARWAQTFGLYLSDQITPLPSHLDPLSRALEGEELAELELCVRNEKVHDVVVAVTAAPLRDEGGKLTGGVVVLRDVTEQRSLQQMLTQSQKMEAIGRLAGGVAHDFNNLLVVIDSYGELVMRTFPAADERREDLEQVMAASKRAAGLTKQLLAFSRRQMIQPTSVRLNDVVSGVEKMLKRVIGEHIDLSTELASDLAFVRADVGQLEQTILNLTVNARDAMPEGGALRLRTANVSVGVGSDAIIGVPPGDYVTLEVTDTGMGMSADIQRRIFEPFFTTKAPDKGTGLGLATVYGIVQQSRGHITVRSEINAGTSFTILLPALEHAIAVDTTTGSDELPAASTGTILLVEDDDAVRRVAVRVLRHSGYRVLEARRAQDARSICAQEGDTIDLILVDVVMPQISGPKLVEELSAIYQRMRVLYMSGYSEEAVHVSGDPALQSQFLEKPFSQDTLLWKVRSVMAIAKT
jgi:two-component system cell cycle sensor histidine kinase/response regulator CckA